VAVGQFVLISINLW